jgi:hypothetical protein
VRKGEQLKLINVYDSDNSEGDDYSQDYFNPNVKSYIKTTAESKIAPPLLDKSRAYQYQRLSAHA